METYGEEYKLIIKIDKKQEYLKILGSEFYERIKFKGKMVINNKGFLLKEKISTKDIKGNDLNIIIIFFEKIKNKSLMFENCELFIKKKRLNMYIIQK